MPTSHASLSYTRRRSKTLLGSRGVDQVNRDVRRVLAIVVEVADSVRVAIAGLENSITVIEREVEEADERAQEAAREAAALKDAAGPKIESIRAKIAALEGDS